MKNERLVLQYPQTCVNMRIFALCLEGKYSANKVKLKNTKLLKNYGCNNIIVKTVE